MGFFEDLGKTLSEVGQTTLKKGAEVANTAKFNLLISDEERKIEKVYQEIGRKYYELHSVDYEADYSEMFAQIEAGKEKIAEYKERIKEVKGITKCENCGSDIPANVTYCPSCGTAVKEEEVAEPEDREEVETETVVEAVVEPEEFTEE